MSTPAEPAWHRWAPPLDPPTDGGLPEDRAAAIARACWDSDPHLAAAIMWEDYAATLPQTIPVAQVATGSQSVSYQPAAASGDYGLAIARANWHRGFLGGMASVACIVEPPGADVWPITDWPVDWWQRNMEHP